MTPDQIRSIRTRAVIIGGAVPLGIAAIATLLIVSWMPDLPDPVAVHWNWSGPDDYGSVWVVALMPPVVALSFGVFAVGAVWRSMPSGLFSRRQKLMLATSVWLSALVSVVAVGSLAIQRGLDDASQAGGVGAIMGLGFAAGFVLAVPAWFLLPPADTTVDQGTEPPPIQISATEQLFWYRTVSIARVGLVVIFAALAVAVGSVVLTATLAPAGTGFALGCLVVVLPIALMTVFWRITVDDRGLSVRSVLGWPRVLIRPDAIKGVRVVEVNPSSDFGGWGWRYDGAGRSGIVLRAGEAIEVTRRNGKRFVVTVEDAATGAGVLAALVQRHSQSATTS